MSGRWPMNWLRDFAPRIERDAPIGRLTWYRLGGSAKYLFRPTDRDDLAAFLRRAGEAGLPVRVLGAGANVLVRDGGVNAAVVRLDQPAFRETRIEADGRLDLGAGVDLMVAAKQLSAEGWSGLEGLAGIPGTIGGAVRMNAGGRHGEFGDRVISVDVMDVMDARDDVGEIERWPRERVGFGYRCTSLGGRIVLSAQLRLERDDPQRVQARFAERWEEKRAGQPLADHSAGCVFKNPPDEPAGRLIDRAGLKGLRSGGARVSEQHANFIVADRGASADDVLRLIELVRAEVAKRYGFELETEIDVW
jgi:UDP-N-acetylmuramate dehydrogenase